MAYMKVNIDKPGGYVQAGYIDHFPRRVRRNALRHCRYLPRGNPHIGDLINIIGRVNDMTALQEKVVVRSLCLRGKFRRERNCKCQAKREESHFSPT